MANFSIVEYFAEHEGYRCGYCKSPNTNYSHGMWAHSLDVQDYQDLIDRGWRRSGKYCYKPTMNITCCPMYTIRCGAINFKLSKSQKKVIKKVNNFLVHGKRPGSDANMKDSPDEETSDIYDVCDMPDVVIQKYSTKAKQNLDLKTVDDSSTAKAETNIAQCSPNPNPAESRKSLSSPTEMSVESSCSSTHQTVKKGLGADPNRPQCKKAKEIRLENKRQKLMKRVTQGQLSNEKFQEMMSVKKRCPTEGKSLEEFLNDAEIETAAHRLTIKLVRSDTEEHEKTLGTEFATYQKYQMNIHREKADECTRSGFHSFLVNSPLTENASSSGPPLGYGSFHQQYWLDDKLIAVGVIDILPSCVSSVYLFYDPEYSFLSLGTYSALREIAFTRELSRSCPELKYYYMGFYIHSCPKMRYKAQYSPSILLCPETYSWVPYETCVPRLDAARYTRLDPDSTKTDRNGTVDMAKVLVLHNRKVKFYPVYAQSKSNDDREEVHQYASLVGKKCYRRMLLFRK